MTWLREFGARHVGLLASSGIALVWLVLAFESPDLNRHAAPLFTAASWAYARRLVDGHRASTARGAAAAAGGLAVALITVLDLELAGVLGGATLWGGDEVVAEAIALAAVGALWGFRVATRAHAGWLLPTEASVPT